MRPNFVGSQGLHKLGTSLVIIFYIYNWPDMFFCIVLAHWVVFKPWFDRKLCTCRCAGSETTRRC